MGIFDKLLGKGGKNRTESKKEKEEFGGYKTKSEKEAWACAIAGSDYALQGRYADAIGICDMGLKKNPKCKEAWLVKGSALGLTVPIMKKLLNALIKPLCLIQIMRGHGFKKEA